MEANRYKFFDVVWIFILSLMAFSVFLQPEFIAFQTRFALFAKEMLTHGVNFFPITYQGPYPDYPATPTIFIYSLSLLSGKFNTLIGTLPTAVVSSFILVMTYLLGAIHSRRWGIYAVLFALLTQAFFDAARSISPDQYTSLFTVFSFYLIYSADFYDKKFRLLLLPIGLMISFICRGPIGFIIPAAVCISYYLYHQAYKKCFILSLILAFCFLLCMSALLLAAIHQGGLPFMKEVIGMQAVGRMGETDHGFNYFYYWYNSLGSYFMSYPIALIVIAAYFKSFIFEFKSKTQSRIKFLGSLSVWLLIILIGLSIPGAKKIRYILPIVPACSLLAASIFMNGQKHFLITFARKIVVILCTLLPFITFILSLIALNLHDKFPIDLYHEFLVACLLSGMLVLSFGVIHFYSTHRSLLIVIIGALTLILINISLLEPINYAFERTNPFVHSVQTIYDSHPAPIIFYKIGPDAEDIKFVLNWSGQLTPKFIQSEKQLLAYKNKAYMITEEKYRTEIMSHRSYKILTEGHIGHKKCFLFSS